MIKNQMNIAFATYAERPAILPDDELTASCLRAHGVNIVGAVWDNPDVRWSEFDAVIIRSTWDYYTKAPSFLAWLDALERANVRVWNPLPLMRWNADKIYLRSLEYEGVPIVPTVWLERGSENASQASLLDIMRDNGFDEIILKPTISAGAYRTARVTQATAEAHQALLTEILTDSHVMIQPYLREIETLGEVSLMFFNTGDGGVFSHAARKTPQAGDFRIQEEYGGLTQGFVPSAELLEQAHAVLDATEECISVANWLYARVDGVEVAGKLLLMELEMIEPSLFFETHADAPERFARAVLQVIR